MNEILTTQTTKRVVGVMAVAVGIAVTVSGLAGAASVGRTFARAGAGTGKAATYVFDRQARNEAMGRASRGIASLARDGNTGKFRAPNLALTGGPAREGSTVRSIERAAGYGTEFGGRCASGAKCSPRIVNRTWHSLTQEVGDLTPVR